MSLFYKGDFTLFQVDIALNVTIKQKSYNLVGMTTFKVYDSKTMTPDITLRTRTFDLRFKVMLRIIIVDVTLKKSRNFVYLK